MSAQPIAHAYPNAHESSPRDLTCNFHGEGGSLFFLMLKNAFLTLITLGIYSAWARTERRKYMWSNVEIDGQRLHYTGTGQELFYGHLKIAGAYIVVIGLPALAKLASPVAAAVVQVVLTVCLFVIVPFAIFWSRRYLLSRTSWRGIRFGLAGDAKAYAIEFIKGALLTVITLGIYGPVWGNRIHKMMINDTRYGNASFHYTGRDSEVWLLSIKGFVLSVVTLGIYSFWYHAELARYRAMHTHFAGATACLELRGGQLLGYTLLNLIGTTMTLGIAFPWIVVYMFRRIVSGISFRGAIDFREIMQRSAVGDAAADGLADAVGVELGI